MVLRLELAGRGSLCLLVYSLKLCTSLFIRCNQFKDPIYYASTCHLSFLKEIFEQGTNDDWSKQTDEDRISSAPNNNYYESYICECRSCHNAFSFAQMFLILSHISLFSFRLISSLQTLSFHGSNWRRKNEIALCFIWLEIDEKINNAFH